MNNVNPFTWGFNDYDSFESYSTQFNATYKDVPNNVYDKTEEEAFFNEDPTSSSPNIASVCHMDSTCDSGSAII